MLIMISSSVVAVQDRTYEEPKIKIDLLNVNPSPIHQGGYFTFVLKVTNYGDESLYNLKFSFADKHPLFLAEDDYIDKYINFLGPGDTSTITYKIRASPEANVGINQAKVQFYVPRDKKTYSYSFDVSVKAKDDLISLDSIKTIPERINPGQEADLIITLANDGESAMSDINVRLTFDGVPLSPINSFSDKRVVSLGQGQSVDIPFRVIADADAESKAYKIPINIDFYDRTGVAKNRNGTIGIIIDALPEFQLDLEDTKIYTSGDTGEVVISMSNVGPSGLKFVTMELMDTDDYDIISNRRVYLGNLESDDFETAEYNLFVKSKKDVVPLKVKVSYKNNFNENFDDIREVDLRLFSSREASKFGLKTPSGGIGYIYLIIVLIFAYYFIVEWKKQRNIPKAFKTVIKRFFTKLFSLLGKIIHLLLSPFRRKHKRKR